MALMYVQRDSEGSIVGSYARYQPGLTEEEPVEIPDPDENPNAAVDAQILALEATVTQRRLREAALTEAGRAWLADVDAQIEVLRAHRV